MTPKDFEVLCGNRGPAIYQNYFGFDKGISEWNDRGRELQTAPRNKQDDCVYKRIQIATWEKFDVTSPGDKHVWV